MGIVDIDICVSSHLKEELACAADKRLQVISTVMLFEKQLYVHPRSTKELKGTKAVLKQYCIRCYVALLLSFEVSVL